jgi:hypothetical protein
VSAKFPQPQADTGAIAKTPRDRFYETWRPKSFWINSQPQILDKFPPEKNI